METIQQELLQHHQVILLHVLSEPNQVQPAVTLLAALQVQVMEEAAVMEEEDHPVDPVEEDPEEEDKLINNL